MLPRSRDSEKGFFRFHQSRMLIDSQVQPPVHSQSSVGPAPNARRRHCSLQLSSVSTPQIPLGLSYSCSFLVSGGIGGTTRRASQNMFGERKGKLMMQATAGCLMSNSEVVFSRLTCLRSINKSTLKRSVAVASNLHGRGHDSDRGWAGWSLAMLRILRGCLLFHSPYYLVPFFADEWG